MIHHVYCGLTWMLAVSLSTDNGLQTLGKQQEGGWLKIYQYTPKSVQF